MTRICAEALTAFALVLSFLNRISTTPDVFGKWTPYIIMVFAVGLWSGYILHYAEEKTKA